MICNTPYRLLAHQEQLEREFQEQRSRLRKREDGSIVVSGAPVRFANLLDRLDENGSLGVQRPQPAPDPAEDQLRAVLDQLERTRANNRRTTMVTRGLGKLRRDILSAAAPTTIN